MAQFSFIPADLAPGDTHSMAFETDRVKIARVRSPGDPLFEIAYARLWEQFGASHEIESREVLGRRLAWNGTERRAGFAMRYDLLLVRSAEQVAAVRDHTAVADSDGLTVHLSHLLIDPAWRRGGLAGWMRALPIQTARECLAEAQLSPETPITLAAEMEYPDGLDEARDIRLKAYERAGFKKVDPRAVAYNQPDFRSAEIIDATGGPRPLPFQLILRRVGREAENEVAGAELRSLVTRLYQMYAQEFRPQEMEVVWRQLDAFPPAEARIALVPPTS